MALPKYVPLWPLCEEWAVQSGTHPAEILAALCEHAKARRLSLKFFMHRPSGEFQGHSLFLCLLPALAAYGRDAVNAVGEIDAQTSEVLALCRQNGIRPPPTMTVETGLFPWINAPQLWPAQPHIACRIRRPPRRRKLERRSGQVVSARVLKVASFIIIGELLAMCLSSHAHVREPFRIVGL